MNSIISMVKIYCKIFTLVLLFFSVGHLYAQQKANSLHQLNMLLINTVMDDLFTPPVASRIYVYPNIAFYQCIIYQDSTYPSLVGKLTDLNSLPAPSINTTIDYSISAAISFSFVAQSLVGSEYKFEDWRNRYIDSLHTISNEDILKLSIDFGKSIADSIITWARKDNYIESKGMMRNVLSDTLGSWQPTPNDYASGLEPNWFTLRPMILKSCSQFSPQRKLVYSSSKKSDFYKNVLEVYSFSKKMDSLKRTVALYWDDNPNISVQEGHLTYFIHKISPGGHWLMIARQACIQNNVSFVKTSFAYTLSAISIYDAFISCWDEKYRSNLIRPVTVINQLIDDKWEPLIQTPPFPEFTSGHAVISNAAATVLTTIFGESFSFTDSTEIPFGMAPRSFNSFYEASEESSWSRVYGGIHYPETARISIQQGKQIGNYVMSKIIKNGIPKK